MCQTRSWVSFSTLNSPQHFPFVPPNKSSLQLATSCIFPRLIRREKFTRKISVFAAKLGPKSAPLINLSGVTMNFLSTQPLLFALPVIFRIAHRLHPDRGREIRCNKRKDNSLKEQTILAGKIQCLIIRSKRRMIKEIPPNLINLGAKIKIWTPFNKTLRTFSKMPTWTLNTTKTRPTRCKITQPPPTIRIKTSRKATTNLNHEWWTVACSRVRASGISSRKISPWRRVLTQESPMISNSDLTLSATASLQSQTTCVALRCRNRKVWLEMTALACKITSFNRSSRSLWSATCSTTCWIMWVCKIRTPKLWSCPTNSRICSKQNNLTT